MSPKGISRATTAVIAVVVIVVIAIALYLATRPPQQAAPTSTSSAVSTSTSIQTSAAQNVTLYVVAYTDPTADYIRFAGQLFHQLHPNVVVQVITYPFSQYLTNELTALQAHSSEYDIIEFTSTSSLRFAPYVVPLNQYMGTLFNASDLIEPQEDFGGVFYNTTSGQTEYIGVAFETDVFTLAYRCSLFSNQTLAQEFYNEYHMSLDPSTWQNWTVVLDVDKFFVGHNITKYGVIIPDDPSHDIIDAYPAVFGWWYLHDPQLNQGKPGGLPTFNIMFYGAPAPNCPYPLPDFNTTDGIQALQVYKELVSYEPPPNQTPVSYNNDPQLYAQYAPAVIFFSSQLSFLPPAVYNDTCLGWLPGGYAETGTTFLAVSKYSTHKQLALEFLAFLVSPQVQIYEFLRFHHFPISKEAYQILLSNSTLSAHDKQLLKAVYTAAQNAWANPPNIPPTAQVLIPTFNQAVYQYLLGQVDAKTAMDTAAASWINALTQTYGPCRT